MIDPHTVTALAVSGGAVVAGGGFTAIGGEARSDIAILASWKARPGVKNEEVIDFKFGAPMRYLGPCLFPAG